MKPRMRCVGDRGMFRQEYVPAPESSESEPSSDSDAPISIEKHFTPSQVAERLGLSDTKVRRMFQNEPGVLKVGEPSRRMGRKLKRRYYTLRIPESIALKVIARMRNR